MHIEFEISNVSSRVDIGGVSQPVISQKKIVHDIRIREGEVNLLGGLVADSGYARAIAGMPWLAELPVLGRSFGTEHDEKSRGELLIALIPHIVRAPEFSEVNLRGISRPEATRTSSSTIRRVPKRRPAARSRSLPQLRRRSTPAPQPDAAKPAEPVQPRLIFNPGQRDGPTQRAVTVAVEPGKRERPATGANEAQVRSQGSPADELQPGSLLSGGRSEDQLH